MDPQHLKRQCHKMNIWRSKQTEYLSVQSRRCSQYCWSTLVSMQPDPAFYVSSDPDPAILVNVDPDPGIWWTKYEKLYSLKILIFIPRPFKLQEKPPTPLKIRIHIFLLFLVIFARLHLDPHSQFVLDQDPADQNNVDPWPPDTQHCFFSFINDWHKRRGEGKGYTLAGRRGGWGVNILEDARHRIGLLQ